ncbi:FAD:protein FMN transferase [Vannielia sp.]|uniref:FAD:protein FMN transferase n=1 Tax=Vannielia sp. TaxID=2813045 RepID=UPI0026301455|nr:FAD:protein FMN transferase [Vannielia sp.]MDF1873648.1 FAD:protein FMN transferase [Vannielia sp.]
MKNKVIQPTRRHFLGLGGAALLAPGMAWADGVETISGAAFGTTWHLAGPSGRGLPQLRPAIEAAFGEVDRQMSPWRGDSEISGFNAGPEGGHRVSADTARVAAASLALAQESGGRFDPTVGPLVARWGFGPISGSGPDWRGLAVEQNTIVKHTAGLTLDLCGIAKGWALDRAVRLARAAGHENLLLDLGGELAAIGTHPAGRAWRVAVENPIGDGPAPAVLRLADGQAVATSGTQAQGYGAGARTYSHIIDPVQQEPTEGALKSVTVLAPTAMQADGWATALFAAGAEAGPALARLRHIAALFLVDTPEGLQQLRTGAIDAALI